MKLILELNYEISTRDVHNRPIVPKNLADVAK